MGLTLSASLFYRSTCPCAGRDCSGWPPRSRRRAASLPASRSQGPGHSGTWRCRSSSAAAGRRSSCRHPCRLCWRTASGSLWASGQKCPADSRTPACLALRGEMEAFLAHAAGTPRGHFPCAHVSVSGSGTIFTRVTVGTAVTEKAEGWRAGEHQGVRGGWEWTTTFSRGTAPLLPTWQERKLVSVTAHRLEPLKAYSI